MTDHPTKREAEALRDVVLRSYPVLECDAAQFGRALLWCSHAYRQPVPNASFALSFWVDQAREFLQRAGHRTINEHAALLAACVASRITFTMPPRWHEAAVGVTLGTARRADPSWRATLTSRSLPAPSELKPAGGITIVQFDMLRAQQPARPGVTFRGF